MTLSCDVVLDLIPLVKDGVASEASVLLVYEHLDKCENCRNEFEVLDNFNLNNADIKDEKIISAIKRSIFISQFIVLIAGGIFGIALSNSMDMLYNLIQYLLLGDILYYFKEMVSLIALYLPLWQKYNGCHRGWYRLGCPAERFLF